MRTQRGPGNAAMDSAAVDGTAEFSDTRLGILPKLFPRTVEARSQIIIEFLTFNQTNFDAEFNSRLGQLIKIVNVHLEVKNAMLIN